MRRNCSILFVLCVSAAAAAQSASFTTTSTWTSGFQATVAVTAGATPLTSWSIEFDAPFTITSLWDGTLTPLANGRFRVADAGWNAAVPAGGTVSFGFVAGGTFAIPTGVCLTGNGLPLNGVPSTATCTGVPSGGGSTGGGSTGGGSTPPGPPSPPAALSPSGRRVVGYFAAWGVYGRDFHVAEIPSEDVTHINYAFANISPELAVVHGDQYADVDRFYPGDSWAPGSLRGSFHQLQILRAKRPHLRTLISVGGWTWSGRFSDAALTPSSRAAFAQSCVQYMTLWGFDGVDLDWEYPVSGGLPSNIVRPADKQNYTLLLAELRAQLDARAVLDGRPYLLTIAGPAGPTTMNNFELNLLHPYVDWINLMAYDFHGGWEQATNHQAPLYPATGDPTPFPGNLQWNSSSAVAGYLAAGVPPLKINLGMPFYGRGWSGVGAQNAGLFQPSTGLPAGTFEVGVFDYHDLAANHVTPLTRHWDASALVPWVYNPTTGLMVSYDDPESLGHKADFVVNQGLGGAMFWEFSGDDASYALARTIADRVLGRAPWLQAATTGGGAGDLRLNVYARPIPGALLLTVPSLTPAPGGVGTGPVFGLVPDALSVYAIGTLPSPTNLFHFSATASPFASGALVFPAGAMSSLVGLPLDVLAAAYDAAGLLGVSTTVRLTF